MPLSGQLLADTTGDGFSADDQALGSLLVTVTLCRDGVACATAVTDEFLFRNGYEVAATPAETVEMVLAVEGDRWGVDEVESWLRERARPITSRSQS